MNAIVRMDAAADLDAAAGGQLADALTRAFVEAKEACARGDNVLVIARTDETDALRGALGALVRSLARENAAKGVRVNGLIVPVDADVDAFAAFLATPAATMVTGAILESPR
ncbi:Rossmann fold domain-containing protein [Cryptosporangium sp. NPDC048952]|uniref:Rossmann fold domain-containing protein n=1 Tax=Cryptosporangium sp. NPDC048952 TaxID=3363961 RepID=UPI00371FB926